METISVNLPSLTRPALGKESELSIGFAIIIIFTK